MIGYFCSYFSLSIFDLSMIISFKLTLGWKRPICRWSHRKPLAKHAPKLEGKSPQIRSIGHEWTLNKNCKFPFDCLLGSKLSSVVSSLEDVCGKISDVESICEESCCCLSISLFNLSVSVAFFFLTASLSIGPKWTPRFALFFFFFSHWSFKYSLSSMGILHFENFIRLTTDVTKWQILTKVSQYYLSEKSKTIRTKFIFINQFKVLKWGHWFKSNKKKKKTMELVLYHTHDTDMRTLLTFFKIPQILQCVTSFALPSPVSYLGYCDTSEWHVRSARTRVNTSVDVAPK